MSSNEKIQTYINYIADPRARRSIRSLFSKFLNDDSPSTFKDITFGAGTTGITMSGALTTGLTLSGAMTTGLDLSGAMTTGLSITGDVVTGISQVNTVTAGSYGIYSYNTVTGFAGSDYYGAYIRAMSDTNAATAKSLYGAMIYGCANAVTHTTGSLWGLFSYAYVKGDATATIKNIYGAQIEFSMDASRSKNLTVTTEAAMALLKCTTGKMADYTKLHGMIIRLGDMDGGDRTYGNGILIEDDSDMSGTCGLTTGINLSVNCATGFNLTGTYSKGINLSDATMTQGLANVLFGIGTQAAPKSVALTDYYLPFVVNLKGTANAAAAIQAGYFKVSTDGANEMASAQLVGVATRLNVDMNLDSGYSVQGHMDVAGGKTSSELIAVSAYGNIKTGQRTADRVCALQAMLLGEGTPGTVSGECFVAYMVNAGNLQTTDSIVEVRNQSAAETTYMMRLNNDNLTPADDPIMLEIDGRATHGIRMTNMILAQGSTNHFIEIGSYASPMNLGAVTDHVFCSVTNIQSTNDGGSAKWIIGDYSKITITDANAQPNNSVAVYRPKLALNEAVGNAWGMQLDINCTGTWSTNDLIGVGVFLDIGTGTITSTPGKVAAVQGDIYGAGTGKVTGECYAGVFRARGNITGVVDAILHLGNQNGAITSIIDCVINGTATYAFDFGGAGCDAWTSGSAAMTADNAAYALIPVNVDGVTGPLYVLACAGWS